MIWRARASAGAAAAAEEEESEAAAAAAVAGTVSSERCGFQSRRVLSWLHVITYLPSELQRARLTGPSWPESRRFKFSRGAAKADDMAAAEASDGQGTQRRTCAHFAATARTTMYMPSCAPSSTPARHFRTSAPGVCG